MNWGSETIRCPSSYCALYAKQFLSSLPISRNQSLVYFPAGVGQAGRGGGVGDDLTLDAILHTPDLHAVQLPGPDQFMQALGIHTDAPA